MAESAKDRVIVALDTSTVDQAVAWVRELHDSVGAFKVGLQFIHANGPSGIRAVQDAGGRRLFFDGKFDDIPNTVAGAVCSAADLNVWMLNVHATIGPHGMRAAMDSASEAAAKNGTPRPLVIAVTVLTSMDAETLRAIGMGDDVRAQVLRLATLARECGLDGVVASARESEAIRIECGPEFLIVNPGVRLAGGATHDQARVATPADAIRGGADYLVVGRAITAAPDRRAAADTVVREVAGAIP